MNHPCQSSLVKCDLCSHSTKTLILNPRSRISLCESCAATISQLMTIPQWEAAREADKANNSQQAELFLSYARAGAEKAKATAASAAAGFHTGKS